MENGDTWFVKPHEVDMPFGEAIGKIRNQEADMDSKGKI
jgi:hypothetical protein